MLEDGAMRTQRTLKNEIVVTGKGLHSGREITMRLIPAPCDTGVVFIRTDRDNAYIKARVGSVSDTTFATTLGAGRVRVGTVEHLLAALSGIGIDNVYVEIDGPEVPIMDGSALPFVSLIVQAGVDDQIKPLSWIRILKPVAIEEGLCHIAITPYNGRRITYRLFYTHPAFGEQKYSTEITASKFIRDLAPARTFGFLRDVKKLQARGLARGGSLDNAIVLGDTKVLNDGELRFKDEFVRHKIVDAVGDFSLLGLPVYGHVIANKSGHTLHIKLLKKLLLTRDAWEIVTPELVASPAQELAVQV